MIQLSCCNITIFLQVFKFKGAIKKYPTGERSLPGYIFTERIPSGGLVPSLCRTEGPSGGGPAVLRSFKFFRLEFALIFHFLFQTLVLINFDCHCMVLRAEEKITSWERICK